MLKFALLTSALFVILPTTTHAMSKKPPKSQQVGGVSRPVSPTPPPESAECASSKSYADGLRSEATKSLNNAVSSGGKFAQLEINYYNCRQAYAQEAISVAQVSVCGGYLSQSQLKAKVDSNFRACDDARAAEKLAIANNLKPILESQPAILTTPDYRAPASAAEPVSRKSSRAGAIR